NLTKILLLVLLLRSFYLQIVRYSYYYQLSIKNCIRTIETGTPRGIIYDRNMRIIAKDTPCLNLVFVPYDLKDIEKESEILSKIISYSKETIIKKFKRRYFNPYDRIILKRKLTEKEVSLIEENSMRLPGIFVQEGLTRKYPLGKKAAHLIGYTGEITPIQLKLLKSKGYKQGDIIGQQGIEKYYEEYLRGIPGGIQVEVDALGHQRKILGKKASIPGNNLILTIDQTIQEICYEELGGRIGCVIAEDPRNGQILAMVSKPSFDPENVVLYFNKEGNPFLNRAIQGQYPPGSIFKIITEIASLETGVIEEYDRIECTGEIEIGDRVFHCWKEEGHGWVDINLALPFSCNIFFGVIGMKVGVPKILEYAREFELGKPTGIDLPGEKSGYLPTRYETDPLNLSIGQGALLTTPIQLLSLISTVANGGNIWKPYIVKKIVSPRGEVIKEFHPVIRKTVYISSETMEILKRGLRNVVVFGTGVLANVEGLEVAGKTGTAQRAHRELELQPHGAFVCYAPADNPKIALVVYLDSASSAEAALIAGRILRRIFIPQSAEITSERNSEIPDFTGGEER
ncbi:penicillin-binding protein 2, partial [bacterium]|nr:penicillin-binding protein 2 [bacterium]